MKYRGGNVEVGWGMYRKVLFEIWENMRFWKIKVIGWNWGVEKKINFLGRVEESNKNKRNKSRNYCNLFKIYNV